MKSPVRISTRSAFGLVVLTATAGAAAIWFCLPESQKLVGQVVFQIRAQPDFIMRPAGDNAIDFDVYRQRQVSILKNRAFWSAALSRSNIILKYDSDDLKKLEDAIKVDIDSAPELITVSLEGEHPEEIKAILEAISTRYLIEAANRNKSALLRRLEKFRKILSGFAERNAHERRTIEALEEAVVPPGPDLQEKMSACAKESTLLTVDLLKNQSELKVHESILKSGATTPVSQESIDAALQSDPLYLKLLEKVRGIQAGINESKKKLTDPGTQPLLANLERELTRAQEEQKAYAVQKEALVGNQVRMKFVVAEKEQIEVLKRRVEVITACLTALKEKISEFSVAMKSFQRTNSEVENLKAKIAQDEKLAARIYEEQSASVMELDSESRVQIVQDVVIRPVDKGNRRLILSSITGGGILFLGAGLLIGCRRCKRSQRSELDDQPTASPPAA